MLESNLCELLETTEEMTATKKAQTLEENPLTLFRPRGSPLTSKIVWR